MKALLADGASRLAFGVWRLAFGVWRLAVGAWRLALGGLADGPKGLGKLSPGFSLGGVILRASPVRAPDNAGASISTAPNSDDYLLRPFRAGRVYCNATQAKAWAEFPRPFGPKPAPSPTGSQAAAWAMFPRPFGPSGRHQTPQRQTNAQPLTPTANRRPADTKRQPPTSQHQRTPKRQTPNAEGGTLSAERYPFIAAAYRSAT
jgi:hypothetical protein